MTLEPPIDATKPQQAPTPAGLTMLDAGPAPAVDAALRAPAAKRPTRKRLSPWWAGVIAPVALALVYVATLETPRYETVTKLTVRQSSMDGAQLSGLSAVLGVGGPQRDDTLHLLEFLQSRDMFDALDKQFGLASRYQSDQFDLLRRASPWARPDDLFDHWREHVQLVFDDRSAVLTLRAVDVSPRLVSAMVRFMAERAETFINDTGHQIAADQVAFVERQLADSRKRLDDAQARLIAHQNRYQLPDAAEQARATGSVVAQLQGSLAQLETELSTAQSYLTPQSPQVTALQARIAAIRRQIEQEKAKLAGAPDRALNSRALEQHRLRQDVEFAQEVYRTGLVALEKARIESSRKIKHLVVLESPKEPDRSQWPRRMELVLTVLAASVLLTALARLIVETIKDHR